MNIWLGLCLFFSLDSVAPTIVDARFGLGNYNARDFLHIQVDTHQPVYQQPLFGAQDRYQPMSAYRQFMRCRR